MRWGRRARKVVDLVYLREEGKHDIVQEKREILHNNNRRHEQLFDEKEIVNGGNTRTG